MIKYREILRLKAQTLSNRSIASSCGCSRNTVGDVLKRAQELEFSWPFKEDITDTELQGILFPEKSKSDLRKQPDCDNWISAHIHSFSFSGGVTQMVVPDCLKTGVVKASSTDPIINRTYQEMAEHYHTAIMPARVRRPKDKPHVEGTVGIISTWILPH